MESYCASGAPMREFDWFEDASAHQLIADIVNRNQSGSARFVELPQTDHHFMRYPTARAAFIGEKGEVNSDAAVKEMLEWLGEIPRPGD